MELLKGNKTVRWVTPVDIPAYLPICISISPVLTSGRCHWSCPWKSWWSCAGWVSQGDWTASWSDLRHLAPPEVFGPSHIAVAASTQPPSAGNVSDTLQSPPERSGGQTWRDDGLGWFDRVTQSVHRYLISHLNTPVEGHLIDFRHIAVWLTQIQFWGLNLKSDHHWWNPGQTRTDCFFWGHGMLTMMLFKI